MASDSALETTAASDRDESSSPTRSSPKSLSQAVNARRAEFIRPRSIKIKIGSWNVAALPGTDKDIGAWFVDGKGVDVRLSGLHLSGQSESRGSLESVGAQEARRSEDGSTLPLHDTRLVAGGEEIGLYVLGLQEIVELSSAKEYLGKIYNDPTDTIKWRTAVSEGLPHGYELITEYQLSGLLLLIFASPTVAPTITSVSTVGVGTGLLRYLGNKGAVATRIMLGDTTRLVFVNCHLASGDDPANLERRCEDVAQIISRTRFDPIVRSGVVEDVQEGLGDEDFAFWFGDLNFRLEGLPGPDIRRILMLHTRGEYDIGQGSLGKIDDELSEKPVLVGHPDSDPEDLSDMSGTGRTDTTAIPSDLTTNLSDSTVNLPDPDDFVQNPHEDPGSLQATIDSLLPHDQLGRVQEAKKAFHDGWREGPITFLPTYKYDVGSVGLFDSSEKKRSPSWCDRILFRTKRDKLAYDSKIHDEKVSRVKDDDLKARGIDQAADDENVLFAYDPETDGGDDGGDYDEPYDHVGPSEEVLIDDDFVDKIHLDTYTSHQRVLSSDHKPLDAVFTLDYEAVVPELKTKVQQEVARELDRAENEGRPGVTVIADNSPSHGEVQKTDSQSKTSTDSVEGVDLGEISYFQRKSRHLTVANTSQVPATFSFVPMPRASGPDSVAPHWLSVRFITFETDDDGQGGNANEMYTLEPGDSVEVMLEIHITAVELVPSLNEGTLQLEDVLVLRVTDGRDHFIPIHARWLQSCFGRSIPELIRIPEGGVRALPRPSNGNGPVASGDVHWAAPREIFKLTEAIETLMDRVVAEWQMDDTPLPNDAMAGWPFDPTTWLLSDRAVREHHKEHVLDALDTDASLLDAFAADTATGAKLEIIGETTVAFLRSLPDGIITAPLAAGLDAACVARDKARKGSAADADDEDLRTLILDVLAAAPNHNISFVFLTSTLARLAAHLAPWILGPAPSSPRTLPGAERLAHTDSTTSSGGPSPSASVRSSVSLRGSLGSVRSAAGSVWLGRAVGEAERNGEERKGMGERQRDGQARALLDRRLAEVFAEVLVRGEGAVRKGWEERRRGWVEVFLRGYAGV